MTAMRARSWARSSGPSWLSSQTPSSPRSARDASSSRRACQTASGTSTRPPGSAASAAASPSASATVCQSSATIRPFLISLGIRHLPLCLLLTAIDPLLERMNAEAVHRIDEALVRMPMFDVGLDEPLDHVGHFGGGEGRADDLAKRRVIALGAADRDLVPLLAILVDAEDADVADVVVAAGVHAAGDVDVDVADVVQVVEVIEALLDRLRDRNALRIGERAEVAAGAADDVGQQADVRRRKARLAEASNCGNCPGKVAFH